MRSFGFIIFLGVEGVLSVPSVSPPLGTSGEELNAHCLHHLQQLVDGGLGGSSNVTVILSSSWRSFPEKIEQLNRFFGDCLTGGPALSVDGCTPSRSVHTNVLPCSYTDIQSKHCVIRDRAEEIIAWLQEHVEEHPEGGVKGSWIVIDSMHLDLDDRFRGHVLVTRSEAGMTDDDVTRGLSIVSQLPTAEEARERMRSAHPLMHLNGEVKTDNQLRYLKSFYTSEYEASALHALRDALEASQMREAELHKCFDEASYQLDIANYSLKHPLLQQLVSLSTARTEVDRLVVEQRIKRYVGLLQRQCELEAQLRKESVIN